ncbi:hypothetical protein MM221_20315 [Salipaludibacillus sp. LMS25]|jgi:hypothetical protein|uniref:hypothetical protein n=1 Tax=Salipaludibacillus sp. LMS25 TaxID=2924031 RepID=UPI0020D1DF23|nr:hypothetical protein [Salipaludibacillus sp. LMS25]UTR14854.1 hypothetical protein MM221_20315 [Salipaludibacillus sp. LMS25]
MLIYEDAELCLNKVCLEGIHQIWYGTGGEIMKMSLNSVICLGCADWEQQENVIKPTQENLLLLIGELLKRGLNG